MMDVRGKKFVIIGGAGLIGSHAVDQLTKTDVGEVVIYDNFVRGTHENLTNSLRDPRVRIFEAGGDITQTDVLDAEHDPCGYRIIGGFCNVTNFPEQLLT